MAYDNTEIEIKIPLTNEAFSKVKEKLRKEAKFIKKSSQEDIYFNAPHRNFLAPEFPFEWLSIRRRGNKSVLNYKHWWPENAEIHTHCNEFETEISDPGNLEKIFFALGFKTLVTVKKERELYNSNDEFEIGLDTVENLGYFIEIEAVKNFGSVEKARKKLFELAEKLEVDASKTDERGYPFDLMTKQGLLRRSRN